MGEWHTVQRGECLSELGERHRIPWKKIWDHSENETLREKRADPNVLFPGDRIFIPEVEIKQEPGATAKKHSFTKPGGHEIRVAVLDFVHKPLVGVTFQFSIDGAPEPESKTDSDGLAKVKVKHATSRVQLRLPWKTFAVNIGDLDPANTISGVQQRLLNLGFDPIWIDNIWGPKTAKALREFQESQRSRGIKVTGRPDEATVKRLRELHDNVLLTGDHNTMEAAAPTQFAATQSTSQDPSGTLQKLPEALVCEGEELHDALVCEGEEPHEALVCEGEADAFDPFRVADTFIEDQDIVPRGNWARQRENLADLTANPDWDYTIVVIHHSGNDSDATVWSIEDQHINEKGYSAVGYHFLITRAGKVYEGRRLPYKGSHVEKANTGKIGIVLIGDYEHQIWDFDDHEISVPQMNAAVRLINALTQLFPLLELGGHKDWKSTTECPGAVLYAQLPELRRRTGLGPPS